MIEEIIDFTQPLLNELSTIRGVLGGILMLFLPGFAWTLVLFSGRQINIMERFALSVGLSIATITLTILALNKLLGVSITGANSVLTVLIITVIPITWYLFKKIVSKRRGDSAKETNQPSSG